MSIIAVKGIPIQFTLKTVMKLLVRTINGQFEALNFEPNKGVKKNFKICYLRLSEKLDPLQVVEKINRAFSSKAGSMRAFLPEHIPDIPLAVNTSDKLHHTLSMSLEEKPSPEQVLIGTHSEILIEMQSKYTGLYDLSKKTGHKLLENLAQTVLDRLKHIIETNPSASESCIALSKWYRKTHPHFGDFQLLLSTLHRLQDAAGVPRAQVHEHELAAVTTHDYVIDNIPLNRVQQACTKYSDRIVKKVTEHVKNLKSTVNEGDTEEEVARKKVREELKKLSPYLSLIIKQVISKHLVPQKSTNIRMRIYGEPFLPSKEQVWLRGAGGGAGARRSRRMYNLLELEAPRARLADLLALDGTIVGGAKLMVRSADMPLYEVPATLVAEMRALFAEPELDVDEGGAWTQVDEEL